MAAAAHKRVMQLGILIRSRGGLSLDSSLSLPLDFGGTKSNFRSTAQSNGKRAFLVETLALTRRLEAQGMPSKQAEVVTVGITEVLNNSFENVSHLSVSKEQMQTSEMIQDASLSKLKSEIQKSQEHHFSLLQCETKKLRSDIEKMSSELRDEVRFMVRDEFSKQSAETSRLTNKYDREIDSLRAHLKATKYEVLKYCIGTFVSLSVVGLGVIRNLL